MALGNLGVIHHLGGDETGSMDDYAEAERLYVLQLDASTRLGLEQRRELCLGNLAQVCIRLGRLEDSRRYHVEGLRAVLGNRRRRNIPLYLLIEADLRLADGDVEGALVLIGAVQSDPSSDENDHQEVDRFLDLSSPPRRRRRSRPGRRPGPRRRSPRPRDPRPPRARSASRYLQLLIPNLQPDRS